MVLASAFARTRSRPDRCEIILAPQPHSEERTLNPLILLALGLLAGIGAGFSGLGGGFVVVPILIFLGYTPQKAVGTSFLAILIISLSALFAHGSLEHVDYRTGAFLGIGGLVGAQLGARVVEHVSGATFNKIFAVVLVVLAVRMFLQK
jgi:uncharacterized membrane protein YfcA